MIIEEVKKELTGHIIPFWNKLRDDENGGFYGFMSYDLKLDKQADKGVILHARILWGSRRDIRARDRTRGHRAPSPRAAAPDACAPTSS